MREIKFRQWSNRMNEYLGYWGIGDINKTGAYQTGPFAEHNSIHEQFTGLMDKNGREIYEGDIVNTHPIPRDLNPEQICVVKFESWGVELFIGDDMCVYNVDSSTEIIGNIHENGDLLK